MNTSSSDGRLVYPHFCIIHEMNDAPSLLQTSIHKVRPLPTQEKALKQLGSSLRFPHMHNWKQDFLSFFWESEI